MAKERDRGACPERPDCPVFTYIRVFCHIIILNVAKNWQLFPNTELKNSDKLTSIHFIDTDTYDKMRALGKVQC